MLPGPDEIVACPHCAGLAKYQTLTSGNTLGLRMWTDGRQIAPMLPQPPPVVACRHCGKPYWLTEAKEIGELSVPPKPGKKVDPAWQAAEYVVEASEEGYYIALKDRLSRDPEVEKLLRTFVWWRGNDADRGLASTEEGIETAFPEEFRANLSALEKLFSGKNMQERIMKAEALRELGEFAASLQILDTLKGQGFDLVVQQIRDLCEQEDTAVREVKMRA